MNVLRRLSHDAKQVMLISSKCSVQPMSETFINQASLLFYCPRNTVNLNYSQDIQSFNLCNYIQKCNFHTSTVNRDLEAGLKCLGAGFAMVGAIGPGIGIGTLFGNLVTGIARNPSTKDQLFVMAIMGTAFCEAICLFCFIVSMISFFV